MPDRLDDHKAARKRAGLWLVTATFTTPVRAELLHLHPTTAGRWVHDAGGDWNRYAAHLIQARNHQP